VPLPVGVAVGAAETEGQSVDGTLGVPLPLPPPPPGEPLILGVAQAVRELSPLCEGVALPSAVPEAAGVTVGEPVGVLATPLLTVAPVLPLPLPLPLAPLLQLGAPLADAVAGTAEALPVGGARGDAEGVELVDACGERLYVTAGVALLLVDGGRDAVGEGEPPPLGVAPLGGDGEAVALPRALRDGEGVADAEAQGRSDAEGEPLRPPLPLPRREIEPLPLPRPLREGEGVSELKPLGEPLAEALCASLRDAPLVPLARALLLRGAEAEGVLQ
jgi:hypothetical protein